MAQGTGLPLPKSEAVRTQPITPLAVIDADKFSSAKAWTEIANAGARIAKGGVDTLAHEAHQLVVGAIADHELEGRDFFRTLRNKRAFDPQGFEAEARGFIEGKIGNADRSLVPHLKQFYSRELDAGLSAIQGERRSRDRGLASNSWSSNADITGNDVLGAATAGTFNTEDGLAKLATFQKHIAAGVAANFISPEEAERRVGALTSQATVLNSRGSIKTAYEAGGRVKALQEIEGIVLDERLRYLSPDERVHLGNRLRVDIHAWESERKASLGDAQLEAEGLLAAKKAGLPLPETRIKEATDRLKKFGGAAEAASFLADLRHIDEMSFVKSGPFAAGARYLESWKSSRGLGSALIGRESGGDPGAVNPFGYSGLFQFGAPRLADLGVYQPGGRENLATWSTTAGDAAGKWSGTFRIPGHEAVKTVADFRASPEAQRAVFELHQARMDREIAENGLQRFIGTTVGGVEITREGLQAMIHLGGVGGARRTLESGGKDVARDANGVSVLDYARLGENVANSARGSATAAETASGDLKRAAELTTAYRKRLVAEADSIVAAMNDEKSPVLPTPARINQLVDAAAATNDPMVLNKVAEATAEFQFRRDTGAKPLPEQQAEVNALRQRALTSGLDPVDQRKYELGQSMLAQARKAFDDDALGHTMATLGDRVGLPTPDALDMRSSGAFQAGLRQRAAWAAVGMRNFGEGAVPALQKAEIATVRAALDGSTAEGKARILGDLSAALPRDVLGPTLGKIGETGQRAQLLVLAGSMYGQAPDMAASLLKGAEAQAVNKDFVPHAGENGKAFRRELARNLPSEAFAPAARMDPSGPYTAYQQAIEARYAFLSAQAGDTSGTLDTGRLRQARDDVTGGIRSHNGGQFIAPWRGASQVDVDATIWGYSDADLAGVQTQSGTPITADYLRRSAKLVTFGEGSYLVQLNADATAPKYALKNGEPFVIDLRGRPKSTAAPTPQFEGDTGLSRIRRLGDAALRSAAP